MNSLWQDIRYKLLQSGSRINLLIGINVAVFLLINVPAVLLRLMGNDMLANFANQAHEAYTIGLPGPGHWRVHFNSDWQGYDGEFGDMPSFGMDAVKGEYDGFKWHGSIAIAPYAVLILSQEG